MLILMINQWRIQKTSEGMAVFQKGVAVIVKKYISTSIRGKKTFFFHFYCEKMRKKISQGGGGRRFAEQLDPPVLLIYTN